MADKNTNVNIKVIIDAAESAKTVQQTRQALRDLRSAALQVEEGSEAFNALNQAAGELQDRMGDLTNQTKFFADDFRNLTGLASIGTGIAGGFNVLQGTMALVSGESEVLDEAMKKVQITMGIINGIKEVSILLNKNETAAIFANSVATKTAAAAQAIYAAAVGTSTGALRAFRIALLATGIGAIIVGIGLLIENWDKLTSSITSSTDALGRNTDEVERNKKANEERAADVEKSQAIQSANIKTSLNYIEDAVAASERDLALMKSRGDSQVKLLQKEKEINDERAKMLKYTLDTNKPYDKTIELAKEDLDKKKGILETTINQLEAEKSRLKVQEARKDLSIAEKKWVDENLQANEKKLSAAKLERANGKDIMDATMKLNEATRARKDLYDNLTNLQNRSKQLELEIAEEIKKEDKERTEKAIKLNEEREKKAIELAGKTKEERKKILDAEFKDIELYMEKLKLTEQAAFQRFGIPQELLEENINKLKDNAEQEFMLASNLNKSRFELNMRLIEQESKIRSDFRQQQIGEEIRYATMEYEKKREAVRNTIADSAQRNELLTSLEEQHQLNIQRINTVGQNEILKIAKDTEAKKLAEIRRNQEEEKQIRQQALDVMVQSTNEAYDAIAAKVQDTYQQMIDMSNAEYAVRQKNIDREIEDFRNQSKEISAEEQARLDKEAEFQARKDALEAERAAKEKKLKSEAFEKQRQMDMLAILANTAVAITKQLAATPLPLGAPLIAAIAAQGVIQTAIVASQQPAFSEGGLVLGAGGPKDDRINARLSNGESVINAKSTRMFAPILSQINQAGGGRPIPHMAAGGMVGNAPMSGMDTSRLENAIMSISDRPIETYVKEASITSAQARTIKEKRRTSF